MADFVPTDVAPIPAIVICGLSGAKKRALRLADNRIALSAGWNREQLAIELAALPELLLEDDFDISVTGFSAVLARSSETGKVAENQGSALSRIQVARSTLDLPVPHHTKIHSVDQLAPACLGGFHFVRDLLQSTPV